MGILSFKGTYLNQSNIKATSDVKSNTYSIISSALAVGLSLEDLKKMSIRTLSNILYSRYGVKDNTATQEDIDRIFN